ncbi:MAG: T9SS type A sorting domain-containing protein, partial [Duncaniella sp.]|nr:T9SS type A sorting domain-containing protein [Duncaniella sp.]
GTLSWNTIKHTRGNVTGSLAGCNELFMVYNGAGANVFDLYFEPENEQSGISSVTAENGVTVCAEAGSIVVNAASAAQVAVYGLNGVAVVNTAVAAGSHTFAVAPGFYVVKTVDAAGAAAAKVIVK